MNIKWPLGRLFFVINDPVAFYCRIPKLFLSSYLHVYADIDIMNTEGACGKNLTFMKCNNMRAAGENFLRCAYV